MKLRDVITLAFETLTVAKFRSFLSVLGVTIGVAAVIAGVIIGVGNRESIMQKLAESGADVLWFYTKPEAKGIPSLEDLVYTPDLSITKDDVEYIKEQCSTISEIAPYLFSSATLRYGGKYHTIKAIGFMSPAAAREVFRIQTESGRFLTELDMNSREKVCVVEKERFSDEIFGKEIPLGSYVMVGGDKYRIVGTIKRMIFRFGYPERLIVLFPSSSLQQTLGTHKYTTVELRVKNIADVPKAQFQLKQALSQRFGYPLKLYISEFSHYVQTALEIVNLLTILIVGIAIISLSVGGVGIMNVMMTMVAEQTREIGISKAIGAKRNTILYLFLAESIILTTIGGIMGIILGLGAAKLVTSFVRIPFIIPFWVIPLGFFLSVIIGVISGSYPANRAAKLDPVVALREF